MHALIYAGSLKVIPAEHSFLIGTHSSTGRGFFGPVSWSDDTKSGFSRRGWSSHMLQRSKSKWKMRKKRKERAHNQQIGCQRWLCLTEIFFFSTQFHSLALHSTALCCCSYPTLTTHSAHSNVSCWTLEISHTLINNYLNYNLEQTNIPSIHVKYTDFSLHLHRGSLKHWCSNCKR